MIELTQLLFAGLAVGSMYALIAVGFVIIYKATGVLNFAHGGLLMFGAYGAWQSINVWQLPFPLVLLGAALFAGASAAIMQRFILQRMVGKPVFTVIMITWALMIVLEQIPPAIWGYDILNLGDPWGISMVSLGPISVFAIDLWSIALTMIVVTVLFLFFGYTRIGIAMRATASDQEAALAQGISAGLIHGIAWFVAGALAGLTGVMLSGGAHVVSPDLSLLAMLAFPAIILGGLDSPAGAVLGGIVIGLVEVLTANYVPVYAPWLGKNFHQVMPYLILVGVLVVRPYGLLGSKTVRRA
jgi:branched-chain amino acid transport system permease protein